MKERVRKSSRRVDEGEELFSHVLFVNSDTQIEDMIHPTHKTPKKLRSRRGQTLVEYALILALISVVAISVLISLGNHIKTIFTTINSQIAIANSSH
jgi:Flp pilus assembly pilin Flp